MCKSTFDKDLKMANLIYRQVILKMKINYYRPHSFHYILRQEKGLSTKVADTFKHLFSTISFLLFSVSGITVTCVLAGLITGMLQSRIPFDEPFGNLPALGITVFAGTFSFGSFNEMRSSWRHCKRSFKSIFRRSHF